MSLGFDFKVVLQIAVGRRTTGDQLLQDRERTISPCPKHTSRQRTNILQKTAGTHNVQRNIVQCMVASLAL
jgi:hypothetical protein